MRRVLVFVWFGLILAACASGGASTQETESPETLESPDAFVLDTPFWIEMDQTVSQQDGPVGLTFLDVTEDSRCPVGGDIMCAWAGQVTISLQARSGDTVSDISLTLPDPRFGSSSAALFNQYTLELLKVEPQPTSLDEIPRSDYRAQLILRQGLPTATPTPVTFTLGAPFWINMDDTLVQADGSLELFFLDVPKDERCAAANCTGEVIVSLEARYNGGSTWAWMTLPDAGQGVSRTTVFDTYTIQLLAVEPGRPSERSAYRAQIVVTQVAPTAEPPGSTPTPASTPDRMPSGTFALGVPFWMGIDQTMALQNGSLGLTFLDVTEDSRCPVGTNVECFWAGQVTIRLRATLGPTAGEVSLTVPDSQMGSSRAGLFGLYTVEILAIEPAKTLDPIDRSAYRAQLIVTESAPEDVAPMNVTVAPSITPAPGG